MKAGWEVKPLGEIAEVQSGGTPSRTKSEYWNGKIAWYSSGELNERLTVSPKELITSEGLSKSNAKVFSTGSLLIGMYDTAAMKMSILDRSATFNQAIAGVKPNEGFSVLFLKFALEYMKPELLEQRRGTRQKNLSLSKIKKISIPIPQLDEQKRIVAVLDEAFDGLTRARANVEANLQNARELFEATRSSVFEDLENSSMIVQLGDICSRVSVGHVGKTSEHYVDEGGVTFIRSQNVRPGGLQLNGAKKITMAFHNSLRKSQLVGGELLFVRVGANRGQCCSVPLGLGKLNCANVVFGRPTSGDLKYLEHYCQSLVGQGNLLGMTTGSAQAVINTGSVATLKIPMPEESLQKKISNDLDKLQKASEIVKTHYQSKLADLDELRQSLLQKAFAGELT